jgi:hypothetical protein
MGEYFVIVNLTKCEYIDPGSIGGGTIKWSGLLDGANGVTNIMAMLMVEGGVQYKWNGPINKWGGRSKGDKSQWIGRWARNKVVMAGDEGSARKIWEVCQKVERNGWTDITLPAVQAYRKLYPNTSVRYRTFNDERRYRRNVRWDGEFALSYHEWQYRHKKVLYKRRMRRKGAVKW